MQATIGSTEPAAALYYNDEKPDKIFYAGLAYRSLDEAEKLDINHQGITSLKTLKQFILK